MHLSPTSKLGYLSFKDDWGMLGRALAKVEPHPTTREKLLTKLQIQ